jgi:hypothetical protein
MADSQTRKALFILELDAAKALPTIKAMKDALKETTKEFENTEKGSQKFEELEVRSQALKQEIKLLQDATKAQTQALGGVNSGAKFAEGSFGELQQQIKATQLELKNSVIGSNEFAEVETKLNSLLQQEIDIRQKQPSLFQSRIKGAIDESGAIKSLGAALTEMKDKSEIASTIATAGVGDLKKAIKELKDEAAKQGGLNSLIGRELIEKAAEAQDKLTELNTSVKNLADGESTLLSIVQGAKGVAAGFTLAQGSAALFGGEQKELMAVLVKVQASMAVLNSLTEISHILQKDSTVALKATSAAQSLYALAVGSSTGAMKLFRLALAGTGIGLLVLLLVELILHFKETKQKVTDIIDSLGIFGSAIKLAFAPLFLLIDGIKALGVAMGLVNSEAANQAEQGIKDQQKIADGVAARYDREIKLAQAAGQETSRLERLKLTAANITLAKQIENLEILRKENGKLSEDQQKQLDDYRAAVIDNQTEITAISLREAKKRADDQKKIDDDKAAKAKAAADAAKAAAITAAKEQADADKQIRDLQISGGSDPRTQELQKEQAALADKLAAIKVSGEQRKKLEALLREESRKKQLEIDAKYDQEEANFRIQSQINIQNNLNAAGLAKAKTDQERFIINLKIINDQANQELAVLKAKRDQDLAAEGLTEEQKTLIKVESHTKEMEILAEHGLAVADLTYKNSYDATQAQLAARQLALEASPPELEYENKLALLESGYQAELLNAEKSGADTLAITAKYEKAKQQLANQTIENTLSATQGMLANVSALLKKGSTEYKIIASAQALIDTYKSATAAYSSASAIPVAGWILGPLAAGAAIAAGLANVAKINSTKEFAEGGLTTFASGGPALVPKLGLIGEAGPEWISPNWMINDPTTAPIIAGLEDYRQGKPLPFADGGFTATYLSTPIEDRVGIGAGLIDAIRQMPKPVIDVVSVTDKQAEVADVEAGAIR